MVAESNLNSHTERKAGVFRKYDKSKVNNRIATSNTKRKEMIAEETQRLELEAYKSVIRAFKAQSDGLSWAKESLMTDLRRELRVSDAQHRELLQAKDDVVKKIREWRVAGNFYQEPAPQIQKTAAGRKRKNAEEEAHRGGAGVLKKLDSRAKKPKPPNVTIKKEEPELLTLEALRNEVGQLEIDPVDLGRLATAKKAAHEIKKKILEALVQCGPDEDDSEKTEDRETAPEAPEPQPQVQSEEKIVKVESEPAHEDGHG